MGRWACQAALAITFGALIGATVWLGATSPATLAIAELAIYAAALLLLLGQPDLLSSRYRTPLDLPLLLLMLLPLVQLLPLPSLLTQALAPGLTRLRSSLGLSPDTFAPLSAYPYATAQAFNRLTAACLVFFIITRAVTTSSRLHAALLALLWLGVAEATYGLLAYMVDSPTILGIRPQAYPGSATGTLVCKNHFAGLMELLLPVSLGYYWTFGSPPQSSRAPEQTARRVLILVATMLMALGLIFSRSRAGLVSLAVALAAMATYMTRSQQKRFGRVAFLALAATVLVYGNVIGLDPVIERFQGLNTQDALGRVEIWKDGLQLARLSPILGSGVGTWPSLFPAVKSTPVQLTFSHAHNDYVEALAEGGLVGLGLLGWVLAATFLQVRKALAAERQQARSRLLIASLFTGILAIAIHGVVDFNLQIPSNLFLFISLLALLSTVIRNPSLVTTPEAHLASRQSKDSHRNRPPRSVRENARGPGVLARRRDHRG